MNQVIKKNVYQQGTQKHINFMEYIGGMNDEESMVFQGLHDGKTDLEIQEDMGLSKKSYERIESSVRAKLLLGVFESINSHMYEVEQREKVQF